MTSLLLAAIAAIAALTLAPVSASASVAPTVTVDEGPAFGRSAFTYQDLNDTVLKYEGGYAAFTNTESATFSNPHGGYDTASNKCPICHAVHRAADSYYLMRGQVDADACMYCHAASGHSRTSVYDANPGGTATSVGHAMGAAPEIPLSAVSQSLETTTLVSHDSSGGVTTATIQIRNVGEQNKMFRLQRTHSQSSSGDFRSGYMRTGPVALTCISCHQPHSATSEMWQPRAYPNDDATLTAGYKLLRASPSGSVFGPDDMPYGAGGPATVSYSRDGMRGFKEYTDFVTTGLVNRRNTIRAIESTITSVTAGAETIWQRGSLGSDDPSDVVSPARSTFAVNQYSLSVWCADCHNLAIGDSRMNASATTTETSFPTAADASDDATASTSATDFVQLKQLTVDLTGIRSLQIRTDLAAETAATVELRADVGSGGPSVSHATTSTDVVPFADTVAVAASGQTTVTLYARAEAGVATNRTFELFLGREQTATSLPFADLAQPAHEASRTHTAPFAAASNGPAQCYTCHRGGLGSQPTTSGYDGTKAGCELCHYGTGSYATDPARDRGGASDWPHSGEASGAYLLGAWGVDASGKPEPAVVTTDPANIRRTVCRRCHVPGSRTHTSTPEP